MCHVRDKSTAIANRYSNASFVTLSVNVRKFFRKNRKFNFQRAFFVYDSQQRLDDRRIFSTLDNPWRTYPVKWFCCCFCRDPFGHSYYNTMFRCPKNRLFFVVSWCRFLCCDYIIHQNLNAKKYIFFWYGGVLKTIENPFIFTFHYGWLILTLTEK